MKLIHHCRRFQSSSDSSFFFGWGAKIDSSQRAKRFSNFKPAIFLNAWVFATTVLIITACNIKAVPPFPTLPAMPTVAASSVQVAPVPQSITLAIGVNITNDPVVIEGSDDLTNWMAFGVVSNDVLTVVDSTPYEFFRAIMTNEWIDLTWTGNGDPYNGGYNLYCGTNSGVYTMMASVGNVTNCNFFVTQVAPKLYFTARAFDTNGDESTNCPEVAYTNPAINLTITNVIP
jgi:hypothetical protein